jgi:mRNA-degrading endonuclease toxin of MazEF toxin-antitoxin module
VLSADAINRFALDVCVVPLTTVERPAFSLRIAIPPGDGGLKQRSWAKCDQVTTIEKALLRRAAGQLSLVAFQAVEQAVRLALQLD